MNPLRVTAPRLGRGARLRDALLLALILAGAASARFVGPDWDAGAQLHPDERFLSMVTSGVAPVDSLRAYLNTPHSSLNPNNRGFGFYVYGQLPVTVVRYLGEWLARPDITIDDWLFGTPLGTRSGSVGRIGRALSAVCDLITVLLVWAIARALYDSRTGLLAAALYAAAALPIQHAHFFTVDAAATMFVAAGFWLAARAMHAARWRDDVSFGLMLGAGLACKISVLPLALLLVLGVGVRLFTQFEAVPQAPAEDRARRRQALVVRAVISLNVALLVSVLTFRLLHPYAFLPAVERGERAVSRGLVTDTLDRFYDVVAPRLNPSWLEQMAKVNRMTSGDDDSPPNHQWATRTSWLFPWVNMVAFGLGWPLGLVAWAAWLWALVEIVRRRPGSARHLLPVAWVGGFFVWYGSRWVTSMRYFLPLYPVLAVLAAWGLLQLALGTAPAEASVVRRRVGVAFAAAVLIATMAWGVALTRVYTRPHPRLAASGWVYEHVPSDITLHFEGDGGPFTSQLGLANDWTPDDPAASAAGVKPPAFSRLRPDAEVSLIFTLPRDGRLVRVDLNGARSIPETPVASGVGLTFAESGKRNPATCVLAPSSLEAGGDGSGWTCGVEPIPVTAGTRYQLALRPEGGSLAVTGAAIATEGDWDDAVPVRGAGHDPWGAMYATYPLQMVWDDKPAKRDRLQLALDRAEYLIISSNRFHASLNRNPRRWPMTLALYRALFGGELGFELVADFSSHPGIGPFWRDDQWAEEAFTVYDHPRVFVFRKTDAYSPERTATVLHSVDLERVERRRADQVTDRPVTLPIPPSLSATGGAR